MNIKSLSEMQCEFAEMFKVVYGFAPTAAHVAMKPDVSADDFSFYYKRMVRRFGENQNATSDS